MIHSEDWTKNNASYVSNEWEQIESNDWTFNESTGEWIRSTVSGWSENGTFQEKDRVPGSDYYLGDFSSGNVWILVDPFPDEFTEIVYNDGAVYENDWYSAEYKYDEKGNAVMLQNYTKEGRLLGTCEFEYAVIDLSDN